MGTRQQIPLNSMGELTGRRHQSTHKYQCF